MTMLTRFCASLAAAGVMLVGVGALARLAGVEIDRGAWIRLARENKRKEVLERQSRALAERNEGKQRIASQVVERRLTLLEAAAEFRRLNEQAPADDLPWTDQED